MITRNKERRQGNKVPKRSCNFASFGFYERFPTRMLSVFLTCISKKFSGGGKRREIKSLLSEYRLGFQTLYDMIQSLTYMGSAK